MSDEATIQPAQHGAATQIRSAIVQASQRTGIDFGYLMAQAKVESGLDADAKASSSSASGLFQFIESTWLGVMQRHGGNFGFGRLASSISNGPSGPKVDDPIIRGQILALRNNPQIASLMAGALAQDNRAALVPVLGREADAGELYLAHFLGSGGASKFLTALQQSPDAPANVLFGKAAAANRPIFYKPSGAARSFTEVMGLLRGKIETAIPDGDQGYLSGLGGGLNGQTLPASGSWAMSQPSSFAGGTRIGASAGAADWGATSATVRPKLSAVLKTSFGIGGGGTAGSHAARAYAKLQAFGL